MHELLVIRCSYLVLVSGFVCIYDHLVAAVCFDNFIVHFPGRWVNDLTKLNISDEVVHIAFKRLEQRKKI